MINKYRIEKNKPYDTPLPERAMHTTTQEYNRQLAIANGKRKEEDYELQEDQEFIAYATKLSTEYANNAARIALSVDIKETQGQIIDKLKNIIDDSSNSSQNPIEQIVRRIIYDTIDSFEPIKLYFHFLTKNYQINNNAHEDIRQNIIERIKVERPIFDTLPVYNTVIEEIEIIEIIIKIIINSLSPKYKDLDIFHFLHLLKTKYQNNVISLRNIEEIEAALKNKSKKECIVTF